MRGRVVFEGPLPPQSPVDLQGVVAAQAIYNDAPLLAEDCVIDPASRGVQNAVVFVQFGSKKKPAAAPVTGAGVMLNIERFRYEPHVLGLMAGQSITVKNNDTVPHNAHFASRQENANSNQNLAAGETVTRALKYPDIGAYFISDFFPWMTCHVAVFDHPHFAVTAADGSFDLGHLPPGSYTVSLWHETLGTQKRQVVVTSAAPVTVEFVLQAKK